MKKCCACGLEKSENEFHWKNKAKGQRQYRCKECWSEMNRDRYDKDPEYYRNKAKEWNSASKKKTITKIIDYLEEHPCVECGETNPIVLSFDHDTSANNKVLEVGAMVSRSWGWTKIKKEIDKCQVLCMNCHTKKTARDGNFMMYAILEERKKVKVAA